MAQVAIPSAVAPQPVVPASRDEHPQPILPLQSTAMTGYAVLIDKGPYGARAEYCRLSQFFYRGAAGFTGLFAAGTAYFGKTAVDQYQNHNPLWKSSTIAATGFTAMTGAGTFFTTQFRRRYLESAAEFGGQCPKLPSYGDRNFDSSRDFAQRFFLNALPVTQGAPVMSGVLAPNGSLKGLSYTLARTCADRWDCFGRDPVIPELEDLADGWDTELFDRRFGVGRNKSPARSDRIDDWVGGWGDMSGLAEKKRTAFGVATADPCLGAAILTRGCTPQRYTSRVHTFSTDVQAIQRQQLVIGACLVAPAVVAYAVPAGIAAGVREGLATLIQWARPVAAAF